MLKVFIVCGCVNLNMRRTISESNYLRLKSGRRSLRSAFRQKTRPKIAMLLIKRVEINMRELDVCEL